MPAIEVTLSLLALHDQEDHIRTFIHQNIPEFKVDGGCAELTATALLRLLAHLGSEGEAKRMLAKVLQTKNIQRYRFVLPDQKAEFIRQFFPEGW